MQNAAPLCSGNAADELCSRFLDALLYPGSLSLQASIPKFAVCRGFTPFSQQRQGVPM